MYKLLHNSCTINALINGIIKYPTTNMIIFVIWSPAIRFKAFIGPTSPVYPNPADKGVPLMPINKQ